MLILFPVGLQIRQDDTFDSLLKEKDYRAGTTNKQSKTSCSSTFQKVFHFIIIFLSAGYKILPSTL